MNNPKAISEEALELLKQIEGFYTIPTNLYGTWYIGYGFTHYENGDPVSNSNLPMNPKQATRMLRTILKPYEYCVTSVLSVRVSQAQYDALVMLCYDIGIKTFIASKLLELINSGEFPQNLREYWGDLGSATGRLTKTFHSLDPIREVEYILYSTSKIIPYQNDRVFL